MPYEYEEIEEPLWVKVMALLSAVFATLMFIVILGITIPLSIAERKWKTAIRSGGRRSQHRRKR